MVPLSIVFDCDGVLLDSNDMKVRAFVEVLSGYPEDAVALFSEFQQASFGLSRYRLVDRFFADFLGRDAEPGEKQALLDAFGAYCVENYARQPVTTGATDTLERLAAAGVPLFVVSGSDQAELRDTLATIGLARYFRTIFGSPDTKVANLDKVKAECPAERIIFVGDATADWDAASKHGCQFLYLSTWAADKVGMERLRMAHGFAEI